MTLVAAGDKFERLEVLIILTTHEAHLLGVRSGGRHAICICECAQSPRKIVRLIDLVRGAVRSCGCLRTERSRAYWAAHREKKRSSAKVKPRPATPPRPLWPICECHGRIECIDLYANARMAG